MPAPAMTYYRPVRNYPAPLPTTPLQIEAPPHLPAAPRGNSALLRLLYPLSGMGMTLLMVFSTRSQLNPLLLLGELSIVPFSLVMMLFSMRLQQRGVGQTRQTERQRYQSYLEGIERRLTELVKLQVSHHMRLSPDPLRLLDLIAERQILWERRPTDEDFLHVRVGLTLLELCCSLSLHEDPKGAYEQDMLQEARALVNRYSHLDAQPLIIPLATAGVISVTGPHQTVCGLVRAMLMQMIAFHAPTEVRILTFFAPSAAAEWRWLKWVPHTRRLRPGPVSQDGAPEVYAMLAETVTHLQTLLETQIWPELEQRQKARVERKGAREPAHAHSLPHLILVLDGFTRAGEVGQLAGLEEVMRASAQVGMTILCLSETPEDEPALTRARLTLTPFLDASQLSYQETTYGGTHSEFIQPDTLAASLCELSARSLAPLQLVDREAEVDYSQQVSLLALHAISDLARWDATRSWQQEDERQLLRVPIGMQQGGPLVLDLKEMALGGYGPHGLLVGATGSGKSELLRTIVTSLALTHDPLTLNFVLVDFKAGAAFAGFHALPHVAGMITNLENDPHLMSRMHASLLGEQQRRQQLLFHAGNLSNIRQYQEKWRRNPEMEPLPYLLIIVDEFAQLIANYDDFLSLFLKFGQVGRSLGMHMLLATQRVDEGRIRHLEGHLRYRICLRTFKPEESTAVLGAPDAYFLPPEPGSGYCKVDEDVYTSFKSALISLPYLPPEQQAQPLDLICTFTDAGQLVSYRRKKKSQRGNAPRSMAHQEQRTEITNPLTLERTEMHMVIERIAQVPVPVRGWRVHTVWQPPLREAIPLGEVLHACGAGAWDGSGWPASPPLGALCVSVGILDQPEEQAQAPAMVDFAGVGGHLAIVGAPQSGKSTLLRTLLAALLVTHSPRDVQIYGIDFGGGLLRVFEDAPHVGAICSRVDREKIRRVLQRLKQLVAEREALFVACEIDGMASYRQRRARGLLAEQVFGDVFLIVDNFGQVQADCETSDQDIVNDIAALIANGLTYGVHVVLATNLWAEIRPRLRSNIGSRLELRLNDPGDSDIDRKLALTIPASIPGRGLHPSKRVFQAALPLVRGNTLSEWSVQQALERLVQRTRAAWQGPVTPPIRMLPLEISFSELPQPDGQEPPGIPLGLEELRFLPFYLDLANTDPHLLILGDRECGKTTLLRTWLRGLAQRFTPEQVGIVLVDYHKTLLEFQHSPYLFTYAATSEQVKDVILRLKEHLEQRLEASRKQTGEPRSWAGQQWYLIVDDYEGVATTTPQTSNPLNPLEPFVQAGRELGFHLLLARRVTDFGRNAYDPIFKSIKHMGCPGLLMRGDPIDGRQALHKQNISDTLPAGRGMLVRRNVGPMLIQVARSDTDV
jgi:DNA segregation ATPase FtsK/SpoIIIE, S-DNA-T family